MKKEEEIFFCTLFQHFLKKCTFCNGFFFVYDDPDFPTPRGYEQAVHPPFN
jgi:hypothetical protein